MPKIIENIKETIIEEGKKALILTSYEEFNMRDIAKACNIGTGTLYNYFSNKEDLIHSIFKEDWAKVIRSIDKFSYEDYSFNYKVESIYNLVRDFFLTYKKAFYELMSSSISRPKDRPYVKVLHEKMEQIIDLHREKGEITNPLSSEKLSYFIVSNLLSLAVEPSISFNELYQCMNI